MYILEAKYFSCLTWHLGRAPAPWSSPHCRHRQSQCQSGNGKWNVIDLKCLHSHLGTDGVLIVMLTLLRVDTLPVQFRGWQRKWILSKMFTFYLGINEKICFGWGDRKWGGLRMFVVGSLVKHPAIDDGILTFLSTRTPCLKINTFTLAWWGYSGGW